jgi:SWI/SNF-related matrix-associated actin-dependent regulator 1 of chromatin subfamily A
MAKLKPTARLVRMEFAGRQTLHAAYDEDLRLYLKSFYPWAKWSKDFGCWVLADYVAELAKSFLEKKGWIVKAETETLVLHHPTLYEYQRLDVVSAVERGYRFLAYEMGMGKTPTAIVATRYFSAKRILIVCPASVREVWRDELDKWWPDHPRVTLIETGKTPIPPDGIVVCSYDLIGNVPSYGWDAIIADECHYIKNYKAGRSQTLLALRDCNPNALRLALSGTPIGNEPKDLYHQLDWLTPGRWGNFWSFANRFCHVEKHQWGTDIYGAKAPKELREQFLTVGSRVTWQEHKHLMPKSRPPQVHRVKSRDDGTLELLECVAGKAVVFTYLKRDAYTLAKKLEKLNRPIFCVTGDLPPPERYAILQEARQEPNAILVATMDSVGTGIDLTAFPIAIFAGLSYKIMTLLQAIGRVYRLTQKEPVQLHFVVQRGATEEQVAITVTRKLTTNVSVIDAGNAEEKLAEMVGMETISDEEFLKELEAEIAETFGGDDEYL